MSEREFKHLPGPYEFTEEGSGDEDDRVFGPREIEDSIGRLIVSRDGLYAREPGVSKKTIYANARLLAASPTLCALLAEIETAIMPLLPDIDPVIDIRKRVKELLDVIEKGGVSE